MQIWKSKQDRGLDRKLKEGDWLARFNQFEFLVNHGLKPEHYLLDIGCGWLRGGFEFIKYLQEGHYYGIEPSEKHLELGLYLLEHFKMEHKNPILAKEKYFDIAEFNKKFDYMLAQSVFTHLHQDMIKKAIKTLIPYLEKDGKFFATFFNTKSFEGYDGEKPFKSPDYYMRVSQPFAWYEEVCKDICKVTLIGEFGHVYGQQMMVMTNG